MIRTILYILPSKQYFQSVLTVLKKETKNKEIIYVTTNKPYSHLINLFKEEKLDADKIFFIDCISEQVGAKQETSHCLFLGSPQQITGLSLAINKAVDLMSNETLVFFDSLSTLLVYNNEQVVGKFTNFLINKLRTKNVSTIMLTLESDSDKKIIKTIQSFVDEVTEI